MDKHLKTIEYDKVLSNLASFAINSFSKDDILKIEPLKKVDAVVDLLDLTTQACLALDKYRLNPLCAFNKIEEICKKAKVGSMLSMGELLKVAAMLYTARIAHSSIVNNGGDDILKLKEFIADIYFNKRLEEEIKGSILNDDEMSDNASPMLASIRKKIRSCNEKIREKLASYINNANYAKYLQDNIITIRQGRFVIPVKAECKGAIQGLLHDQSASGATVFIEPMPIVELNNDLRLAQIEEVKEIERILQEFTDKVATVASDIINAQNRCIMLDIILSKAKYSMSYNGVLPIINNKKAIKIIEGRHPLIDKSKVVPISVEITSEKRILLISGPNTGGKTVTLKTVGLFCAMAATGLYLPAKVDTVINIFDNIYCDIGDEQSIEMNLSTFSSHIKNISDISNKVTANDLLLFDELGAGTDPYEGAALAIGIIKFLIKKKCAALITTHYSELKKFALTSQNILNASMEFDINTLRPTYKILMGLPGTSNALSMAKMLGLHSEILQFAQDLQSSDKSELESVLLIAHNAKSQAEKERDELAILKGKMQIEYTEIAKQRELITKERERISTNARLETKRMVQASIAEANELIEEIKKKSDDIDQKSVLEAKHLRNRIEQIGYMEVVDDEGDTYQPIEGKVKVGQEVFIKSFNAKAKVVKEESEKGEIEVMMGTMRAKFKREDLGAIVIKKKAAPPPPKYEKIAKPPKVGVKEIKILGCTVYEAQVILDKFILDAQTNNAAEIKVIHGLGTGALKRAVWDFLKKHPDILECRVGTYGEGGAGVTFATLK